MEERQIDRERPFVANDKSSEVCEPGDAAFYFPASFVTPKFATVLRGRLFTIDFVRTNQINTSFLESLAQRVRISRPIVDQTFGILPRPPFAGSWNRHAIQRRFNQRDFVRGRRGKLNSQRNTLAACHHHPLCTFSAFGFSDAVPPFFAGAKLPSAKHSSQLMRPCSSSSPRNFRQIESQTSCSSQSRRRLQQVLGEGYCAGRSFHLAPLRSTQRMPSKQRRSSTRERPPFADGLILGSNASIFRHCLSVSSESCRAIKGLLSLKGLLALALLKHNSLAGAKLYL